MLSGTDVAVTSLIRNPHVALFVDTLKTPQTNMLCAGYGPAAKGVIASRQVQIGGSGSYAPADVDQSVRAHTSAATARAAVRLARQSSQQCKPTQAGSVANFGYAGGDESWALHLNGLLMGDTAYTAVIRVGTAVSYVDVMSLNHQVTGAEAKAVFDQVVERMTKVYG